MSLIWASYDGSQCIRKPYNLTEKKGICGKVILMNRKWNKRNGVIMRHVNLRNTYFAIDMHKMTITVAWKLMIRYNIYWWQFNNLFHRLILRIAIGVIVFPTNMTTIAAHDNEFHYSIWLWIAHLHFTRISTFTW